MTAQALVIPTLILIAGTVDDLRSRKVHNTLVLFLLIPALASQFYNASWAGLSTGALGFFAALAMCLPLVLSRTLGAGDMKLFAVFGLATNWNAVLVTLIASLIWGGLLGALRATLQGNGLQLLRNTAGVLLRKPVPQESITRIPYTVALLFGWMSFLVLQSHGGTL